MMTRRRGPILVLLIVALLIAVGAAAYVLTADDVAPDVSVHEVGEPPPDLDRSTAEVDVEVKVTLPDRLDDAKQAFQGNGVVDFPAGVAQMTYDLSHISNAAGFFGHLQQFGVHFADAGMYAEIFVDDPRWILIEPVELYGLRVERLREVALSSPLMLPLLVQSSMQESDSGSQKPVDLDLDQVRPENEAQAKVIAFLEKLGVKTIVVRVDQTEGFPGSVDQRMRFPVTPGATSNVKLRILTTIAPSERVDVSPPPEEHRTMEDFGS